jgi:hypothetical protein
MDLAHLKRLTELSRAARGQKTTRTPQAIHAAELAAGKQFTVPAQKLAAGGQPLTDEEALPLS